MSGFDVLSPDLNLFENHFIEASAGTGKTFAIENIVTRLLLAGVDLERILIVTFTRAATSDLKMRIRKNIASKKLYDALYKFDEAKIFTIHSFCFHSLREYALEADLSLDTQEEPSTQSDRLIVLDYLRSVDDVSWSQIEKMLKNGMDALVDSILRIASDRVPIQLGRTFYEIENELRNLPCDFDRLFFEAQFFGKMCNRQKELKDEHKRSLENFVRFMQGEDVNIMDSSLLLMTDENRLKRAPEGSWDFLQKAVPLVYELSDELQILARLCAGARIKLEESDQMQFEDLLIKMDKKVQDSAFAEKIRAHYDCVLVDEFQDTNPIQWRIFKTLFLNKLLYLVGDPKQAIYRFRHADIYTYLAAKREFQTCDVLDTNYRSTPSVVKKLNELFQHLEITLPKTGEKIECPPVHFDQTKEDEGGVFHLQAENEEQLFIAILNRVQKPFASNAILVKDRYQAERFLHFAHAHGFPAVSRRARSLVDSPAFCALKELLFATLYPTDRQAVMRVLGGQLYAWPIDQLELENPFFDYHVLLRDHGLLAFFLQWSKNQGPALIARDKGLYQDLLQLVEYIAENGCAIDELLPFLDGIKEELPARQNGDADALLVLTTHVSKGLEFDTVFPLGLIKSSIKKRELVCIDGVYKPSTEHHCELEAEEMRQLYVAFTRAKKRLYILSLQNGKGVVNRFLEKAQFPAENVDGELPPLPPILEKKVIVKPKEIQREWQPLFIDSFSSLYAHTPGETKADPCRLPAGKEVGTILHSILEKLNFSNYVKELPQLIHQSPLSGYFDEVYQMIERALWCDLPKVGPLINITHMIKEMEFLYTTKRGYMKGFIDLFFKHEERFYILDWKSNLLEDLDQLMKRNHYESQAEIYKEAVTRYLGLSQNQFGGCFYLFLRGENQVVYI